MTGRLYRDEAVVLRTYRLGEADRIIVMLTRSHGQVRAVAKGVRRTTSRFGARLEPFTMIDVQLYRGRSLDVIAQVETLDPFARAITGDYSVFTCASTMVETAERLTQDDGDLDTSPAGGMLRDLYWIRTCCAPWPWPVGLRRATTARAAVLPDRTPPSMSKRAGRCAPVAGPRAQSMSSPGPWRFSERC